MIRERKIRQLRGRFSILDTKTTGCGNGGVPKKIAI